MPKRHTVDTVNQGSFLAPTLSGRSEIVSYEEQQFPTVHTPPEPSQPTGQPSSPEGLYTDVATRSLRIDRLLSFMGVMAETLPAAEAERDRKVAAAVRHLGPVKLQEMRENYALHKEKFDNLFAIMWDLEGVRAEGGLSPEKIATEFNEDKNDFTAQFIKSDEASTKEAERNRAKYRYKLDSQQMKYQEKNLAAWPYNRARARRIATRKRSDARRRTQRAA